MTYISTSFSDTTSIDQLRVCVCVLVAMKQGRPVSFLGEISSDRYLVTPAAGRWMLNITNCSEPCAVVRNPSEWHPLTSPCRCVV